MGFRVFVFFSGFGVWTASIISWIGSLGLSLRHLQGRIRFRA